MATSIEVWPDTARAFSLFRSLRTQWQVGQGGPIGLNFLVAFKRMDRMGLSQEEYGQLDEDLQVMEAVALQMMHEQIDERASRSK